MINPFWNRAERRPRAFYRIFVELLMRVLFLVALVALARRALAAFGVDTGAGGYREFLHTFRPSSPTTQPMVQGLEMLASVASAWVACRFLDRRPLAQIGLSIRRRLWWLDFAAGSAIGLLAILAITFVEIGRGRLTVEGILVRVPSSSSLATWLGAGLVACVFNAFEEEISDGRGYLIRNTIDGLESVVGRRGAVACALAIGAVLFGFLHLGGGVSLALYTGSLGMVLGLSYVLSRELALAIGIHTTWNYAQVNLMNWSEDTAHPIPTLMRLRGASNGEGIEDSVVCLVGIAVALATTMAWVKFTRGTLSPGPKEEPSVALRTAR